MVKFLPILPTSNIFDSYPTFSDTLIIPAHVQSLNLSRFKNETIFIDNGIYETKQPFSERLLLSQTHTARQIHSTKYLVLPDIIGQCDKTIALVKKYQKLYSDFLTIGVVQAKNTRELIKISKFYNKNADMVAYSAPPFHTDFDNLNNSLLLKLTETSTVPIHLFSFSPSYLRYPSIFENIRSFDSTYPIKCLITGDSFGGDSPRPAQYFSYHFTRNQIVAQLRAFRNWMYLTHNIRLR